MNRKYDRRQFLKAFGIGVTMAAASPLAACERSNNAAPRKEISANAMAYRNNPKTGDKVSLLGYGCMRWPSASGGSGHESANNEIDQEQINRLVDYALAHGVNYFDTAPPYCKGKSEEATGNALRRHDREEYFIATKLSNFSPSLWSQDAGVAMYNNSFKRLGVDHIDYLLLHGAGMHGREEYAHLNGMQAFEKRFIDNGLLEFLLRERDAGHIRNLGFSHHGDVEVFDYLLSRQNEYAWDFAQIQLNYVDWRYAKKMNDWNTNGEYLYGELERKGIPAVIMEPLLGGRLARMPVSAIAKMKQARPNESIASWAFRYAGTPKGVLTVLSGMTFMEHLQDNLAAFCSFEPCDAEELNMLYAIADDYAAKPYIACTACQYCMPCKYGINIPAIFSHYNKCLSEDNYGYGPGDSKYKEARKAFLAGYDRSVPSLRQASHCIGCGQCIPHCPQRIAIPNELHRIDQYVENMKRTNV